jgi:hypothetical protein
MRAFSGQLSEKEYFYLTQRRQGAKTQELNIDVLRLSLRLCAFA